MRVEVEVELLVVEAGSRYGECVPESLDEG